MSVGTIQAVQENEVTLTSNTASLPFAVTDLRTRSAMNCCGFINHNEGSALFSILEGGLYEVTFNANITSATAGTVALALFADGVKVIGTEYRNAINGGVENGSESDIDYGSAADQKSDDCIDS